MCVLVHFRHQIMQDIYFPLCEMFQNGALGGGGEAILE